jgi:hypothetical protein
VEHGASRLCPRCGTPRVGNFRWCRSCQFDFDADRIAGTPGALPAPTPTPTNPQPAPPAPGQMVPAFTLPPVDAARTNTPPPADTIAATKAAPSAGAAPAPVTPAPAARRQSASFRVPRRAPLPLAVAGVVAVVLVAALILIPPRSDAPIAVASPTSPASPTSSSGSAGTSPAPTRAVAPTPFTTISLGGTGSQDVSFSIPDGSSSLATIINDGAGPFTVWTVGADGTRNEQLVSVIGRFAGTRLIDGDGHSTAFSVESDGTWSIELNPVSSARTWDLTDRLTGDGSDVVLVLPSTSADRDATIRYDGDSNFVISAYTSAGKVQLLNEVGQLDVPIVLPAGTSLIEVQADAAWSIAPQ